MVKIEKKDVGKRIKAIRNKGNWTLEEFGVLVSNASKGLVSNWENGVNLPSEKRLKLVAILGNTKVDWLLYGELEDYLRKVFSVFDIPYLDDDFFVSLSKLVSQNKIAYDNIEKILEVAIKLRPALNNDEQFNYISKKMGIVVETIESYAFEEDEFYRKVFLPMLSQLFEQEDYLVDPLKKRNQQIILKVLDMLARCNENQKEDIEDLITKISWLANDNVFVASLEYLPEYASHGGFTKDVPFIHKVERTQKHVIKDFKKLYNEISDKVEDIFNRNYEQYYSK
ncbi:helix-turn-helix transcriptional regulator [Psychrobacillus psychrodurans]|uniref:helix-turn-helix domain-containing protein n=1 Tax=Psychrobacillus psychrodurans TaxID=126157 RepID=UPI001F4DC20B|nr:helix-turn-helix transcriptional regulator [Psychrobacillus psychrodurans]MCK1998144.1 helix-turn-helix transcriptional regulator [Psychrobacillus psychrodurans]